MGTLLAVVIVAAVLGGGAALGLGKGAGWLDSGTKTVVVNAGGTPAAVSAAAAAATSTKVSPLPGNRFDPERIFATRSPGVVTIFAQFNSGQGSQGSGFVMSPKGYVLTNSHVITNAGEGQGEVRAADRLYVEFSDGDRVEAKVVGWDLFDDIGLIKVDPSDHALAPVPLGNSDTVKVGEPVAAIGSPLGNENSLSVGVVSAIHRSIDALTANLYNVVDAIQTDAPITHGNSGGPLLDARGLVIGLNAQIRSQSGTGNDTGIGFAIPINAAKHSVAQLIAKGKVTYAYVGITSENMTPSLAQALGYKTKRGALIVDIKGDPARKAGLRGGDREVDVLGLQDIVSGGDVILAIDGIPVHSADDVVRIVSFSLQPKHVAIFTISRDGKRMNVPVTLGERELPAG